MTPCYVTVSRSKKCSHCCDSKNSTSVVFNRYYILQAALDLWIKAIAVSLTTTKSNPTGTTFELKLVCFFRFFIYCYIETNKNVPPRNIKICSISECNVNGVYTLFWTSNLFPLANILILSTNNSKSTKATGCKFCRLDIPKLDLNRCSLQVASCLKTLFKKSISGRHCSAYIRCINLSAPHLYTLIYTGSVRYNKHFYGLYMTKDKISEEGLGVAGEIRRPDAGYTKIS